MSTVELDLPFDEYVFERMLYACEKAKKSAENALEKILAQKVVPTLPAASGVRSGDGR